MTNLQRYSPTVSLICKLCGSSHCTNRGEILHPKPSMVAGKFIDLGSEKYYLIACQDCGFQFKYPDLSYEKLAECYSTARKETWGTPAVSEEYRQHRRIDFVEQLLQKYSNGRKILDVGCADGSVLAHLVGDWDKYGLEIGEEASTVAQIRGIRILGKTFEDINLEEQRFDIITSFDVVEHIVDPLSFFSKAAALLNPGGIILTVTGDTSGLPWKLLGSLTWYCTLAEHVSFFNPSSMLWLSNYLGLQELEYHLLPHQRVNPKLILRDISVFSAYKLGRWTRGFGISSIRQKLNRGAPSWLSASDHLFHVMRNNKSVS